jgi:hypothetical protein
VDDRAAAPRKEFRIILDAVYQLVQLLGRERDENGNKLV